MYHLNLDAHTDIVVTVAVVESVMFSGSMDGKIKIWDLTSFTVQKEVSLGPVFSLKIASGYLFSGHTDTIKV
jgi:hypothetical protein